MESQGAEVQPKLQTVPANINRTLFVTNVENYGPYLKICGHLNPAALALIRAKVQKQLHTYIAIDPTWPLVRHQSLVRPGILCLYKRVNSATPADVEFLRARILRVESLNYARVQAEVEFIDYGTKTTVASFELLVPKNPEELQNIPPLCTPCIVLGICNDWKHSEIDEVARIITHQTIEISIKMEIRQYKFISLKWKDFDFAEYLIHQKKIGLPVANDLLFDNFNKLIQDEVKNTANSFGNSTNEAFYSNGNGNTKIEAKYNKINQQNFVNLAEPIPVMPPIFSGPNNHRQNVAAQTSTDHFSGKHQPAMRIPQHYASNYITALQNGYPQYVAQQQLATMQRPRMPHTIGNLRPIYQGNNYPNHISPFLRGPILYTSTPNVVLESQYAVPHDTYSSPHILQHAIYDTTNQEKRLHTILNADITKVAPNGTLKKPSRTYPATFKSSNLTVGTTYDVYVSFVENGPCLFSVQLASAQEELTQMMNRIEAIALKSLIEKPSLGSACIARYSEDGQLYRALIIGVQSNLCKVAYIDYGNAELVQYGHLFEIPDEFLIQKPFAIRFTLSGHKELEPLDESMKKAFKDLVLYQHCKLKVMPLEGPPLVQYCKLYLKDQNILNILKQIQKSRLVYAKAEDLESNNIVEIRYIDSPKHFYVQKVSNIAKFENLMDEMFLYYNKNQVVPAHLSLGAPCIVKYDNEWYRAEVMRADDTAIIVRHVDFGYEQKVTRNLLSNIAEQHLQLPRQAVQCCLKGFENSELNKDLATTQFEMLAEESNRKRRSFTVKVFRIQPDGVNLVNLYTKDLNVMKKLYKLSMPFEQYLTFEKEDFNMNSQIGTQKSNANNYNREEQKTPSIISTDTQSSLHSSKKNVNIQLQKNKDSARKGSTQYQQQLNQQKQRDWEKTSTTSSNREQSKDSHSSGDHKKQQQSSPTQKRTQSNNEQVTRQQNQLKQKNLNTSIDSQSSSSTQQSNKQQKVNARNQQQQGRSQNAPQGYSQSEKKINAAKASSNSPNSSRNNNNNYEENVESKEEYVSLDHNFPIQAIETPACEEVVICWWISPHQFYTHMKKRSADFERLMSEMQIFYKKQPLQQLQLRVGVNVVARHRQDNLVYRARVIGCNHMLRKYKVYFVDYGNQYTVTSEDIWQVEKRFANFPCMAYMCAFQSFIANFDHLRIIDCMEKYLPAGAAITCEYLKRELDNKNSNIGGLYFVNIKVNGSSLSGALKADGLITDVEKELRLDLFTGQQIRAKICDIKDLLNFKIQIEGRELKFLSCYDDVRFVKSNPHLAKKFRDFYEGKWCVVNIKDVNDNKVILLRPLAPLFKEETFPYICPPAIFLDVLPVRIVYVDNATRLYGQPLAQAEQHQQLLENMYEFYENKGEILKYPSLNQTCAAQSDDTNWYRARIENIEGNSITVFYIDYGNTENLDKTKLKRLEEEHHLHQSAHVIEINLPIRLPQANENTKSKKSADLLKTVKELTLDQDVIVKSLEVRRNHLIAELVTMEDVNIIDLLEKQQLIKARDLDFVRKQLDKDKKNIYEYIETVDLTLEDEADELTDKKQKQKKKKSKVNTNENLKKVNNIEQVSECTLKNEETETDSATMSPNVSSENVVAEPKRDASLMVIKADNDAKSVLKDFEPAEKTDIASTVSTKSAECSTADSDICAGMEKFILSHCDNPAQFFIHSLDKVEELRKLQENLQIVASSLPPLMGLHNGAYCISQYSVDKQWYRARLIDAELMLLKFIDYGNTDCLSDASELKEMCVFPNLEPFCIPCALPIKPNCTVDWVDAANSIFNESYGKLLYIEYLTHGDHEKRSFINLFVDGVNIADKLVADGYAKHLELVQSDENCYISHVNGITDFYIQYEKDSKALELIELYLAENAQNLDRIKQFERGQIIAALFPDDDMWYRAKLLRYIPNDTANNGDSYEVLFIDYGNTSITQECREISEEIAKLPSLSKRCTLELPEQCVLWSDAAEEKFCEIAAQGETIFTVELCEPRIDCSAVYLYIDGRNINEDLAPLCPQMQEINNEKLLNDSICNTTLHSTFGDASPGSVYEGTVCHINALNDFYVHFAKENLSLQDMITSLEALRKDPPITEVQTNELVAAMITDIEAKNDTVKLYRAYVLETINNPKKIFKWRVFLLDYGSEHYTAELRALPQGLQLVKPFAKHCQLDNMDLPALHKQDMSEVLLSFKSALTKEQAYKPVFIELVHGDVEPAIVKLLDIETNKNICSKVQELFPKAVGKAKNELCIISHAVSPNNFYIQRKSNWAQLEYIRKGLQKNKIEHMTKLENAKLNDICCVYYEEDDLYYRARVTALNDGNTTVHLIDLGNTLSNINELLVLPADLSLIESLAEECQLNIVTEDNIDTDLYKAQFTALVESHFGEFYEIVAEEENKDLTKKVKLLINYEDVAGCLSKAAALALKCGNIDKAVNEVLAPLRPLLHDCTIIHVNSPQDFYLQISEDIQALEKVTDMLLDAEQELKPLVAPITVGTICAALFPEDGAYYRARIVKAVNDNEYEVHYIDFGNNAITDQLLQLPEDVQKENAYAKNCTLHGLREPLTIEVCDNFQTLVDSRFSETFQVEFLKTTQQPIICRLFYQQHDVVTELMDMLKNSN